MAIPLLIPAIIAGVSALAAAGASAAAAGEADAAENRLQNRSDAELRRYAHEKSTNFLDSDSARATLATLRRQNKKQTDEANTDAVKQGMSEEARVAMAGKLNENYGNQTTRLSGFGTQYKKQMEDSHLRRMDSLDNALYNSQLGKSSAWGGLTGAISGLGGAAMSAWADGAFDPKPKSVVQQPGNTIPYGQDRPFA